MSSVRSLLAYHRVIVLLLAAARPEAFWRNIRSSKVGRW